jgi:hypothetical protein
MIKRTVLFCSLIIPLLGSGQLLVPPEERTEQIEALGESLKEAKAAKAPKLDSPFRERTEESPTEEAIVAEIEVDDQLVLSWVSERFHPTGILWKGGIGYLLVPQGRVQEGDSFEARIRGSVYRIAVEAIREKTYRLRLGDAVIDCSIENGQE